MKDGGKQFLGNSIVQTVIIKGVLALSRSQEPNVNHEKDKADKSQKIVCALKRILASAFAVVSFLAALISIIEFFTA